MKINLLEYNLELRLSIFWKLLMSNIKVMLTQNCKGYITRIINQLDGARNSRW